MRFSKKLYGSAFVNSFIAEMEGITHIHRPLAWVDQDGQKYSHIAAAIAMPTFEQDGYLITIGIEFETERLCCLDEYETSDVDWLLNKALEVSKEYGDALSVIYGDPARLMSLSLDLGSPVLVSYPLDHDQKDAFQLYLVRLTTSMSGVNKVLYLCDCGILKNHLLAFREDKAKMKDNPVIYAAGSLVHSLLTLRPWETAREIIDLVPTRDSEAQAFISAEAEKEIMQQVYGGEQWSW